MLDEGRFASVRELAEGDGVGLSYVSRILRLSLLAPDIVEDIQRLLWIIDRLLELKGEVTDWVAEQRERLSILLDLVALARRELADPGGGGGSW